MKTELLAQDWSFYAGVLIFFFYLEWTIKDIVLHSSPRIHTVCFFSPQCLQQYVRLAIKEGGGAPITCPDMACQKTGVLTDPEVCPA